MPLCRGTYAAGIVRACRGRPKLTLAVLASRARFAESTRQTLGQIDPVGPRAAPRPATAAAAERTQRQRYRALLTRHEKLLQRHDRALLEYHKAAYALSDCAADIIALGGNL